MSGNKTSTVVAGVIFTLVGAILFSTKAVITKLIYRDFDISVVSLLALRLLFALPFYAGMLMYALPGFKRLQSSVAKANSKILLVLDTIGIGLMGYYVSSYLDFSGLKFISAGLERIILFLYPTFTLLFAALIYRTKITSYQLLALLVSYGGIAFAFMSDINEGHSSNILKGSLLVFGCAITYSLYVLFSGKLVSRMGVMFFTAVGMISATVGVMIHLLLSSDSVSSLKNWPIEVYGFALLMAVIATVVPSLLLSMGLKRIGSNNVAIISTVGPVATILQAYWFLGEGFGWLQLVGTLLVVAGVFIIGRKAKK